MLEVGTTSRVDRSGCMHVAFMHGALGVALGATASIPVQDLVVTLSIAAIFGVGCGITGFILAQIENAA